MIVASTILPWRSSSPRSLKWALEDQLGALGLVLNMIVLWNTIYMDAALQQLRAEGYAIRDEDAARLSPLLHEHINMLGRHSFIVPDAVARRRAAVAA